MTEPQTQSAPAASKGRRTLRKEGRKKRTLKLRTDKEFAKAYFEARSKRSGDKKVAFKKKKARKK